MSINVLKQTSRLPAEYQEVEYIESTGTQYIDTGLKSDSNTDIEIKYSYTTTSLSSTETRVFGSRGIGNSEAFFIGLHSSYNYCWYINYGDTSNTLQNIIWGTVDTNPHIIKNNGGAFYFDDVNVINFSVNSFTSPYNAMIFGAISDGTIRTTKARVYYCKIYYQGELVRNYIPCYHKSDNIVGLYDLANSGKNLFDYANQIWTEGLLQPDGNINTSNTNYKTTDYIDILQVGKTYSIGFNQLYSTTNGTSNRICFYDANKNFISIEPEFSTQYKNIQRYTRIITVPANAKYIRYSVRNTDEDIQIEEGSIATSYEAYPFYTNAGTGTFLKGNDVVPYTIEKQKMNVLVGGSRLPAEYQEVEYIQGSGTQYINTGISLTSEDTVKCKFEVLETPTSWKEAIYGAMENIGGNNKFFVLLMRSPNTARVGTGSNQATSTNLQLNTVYDTTLSNGTYIENGTTYTFTAAASFSLTNTCYVMSRNQTSYTPIVAKLYSFEIVGKFNGIPCYRKADGVIGMYDTVSETFFTNAGTGTFLKGNNVSTTVIQPVKVNILKKLIPDAYQQVEYIESTGTQYIDTNYIPNQDTVVNCHINMISYNGNDVFFGQRVAYMDNQYEFVAFNSQYIPQLRYNNQTTGAIQGSILSIGDHYIETSKNGLFIDNNRVGNTLNADTFTCEYSIYLFARNNAGTASAFSNIKLYSLKISENNTLIRNFIPCYRKSDNVIGMYDLVNGVFYTNQGTGAFEKGNDVNQYVVIKI